MPRELYGALCKLKDYEDTAMDPEDIEEMKSTLLEYKLTGVSPERLKEMDKLYLDKCQYINALEAKIREYMQADYDREHRPLDLILDRKENDNE